MSREGVQGRVRVEGVTLVEALLRVPALCSDREEVSLRQTAQRRVLMHSGPSLVNTQGLFEVGAPLPQHWSRLPDQKVG